LGTMWTGGDVSARYARTKLAAQHKVDQSSSSAGISNSSSTESTSTPASDPDEELDPFAANEIATLPPRVPKGKATAQAVESRKQVLEDKDGGAQVLAEEAAEEQRASAAVRRSARKKGSVSSEVSLKGLKDRVSGSFPSGVPRVESRR
jgi:sphinganine C4-monooxygenase